MVGFLWKGEREMKRQDKLSVLLMLGILCLVLVNAGAIYHMWLNGEGRLAEMKGEDPEMRSESFMMIHLSQIMAQESFGCESGSFTKIRLMKNSVVSIQER